MIGSLEAQPIDFYQRWGEFYSKYGEIREDVIQNYVNPLISRLKLTNNAYF